ncbi:uromodulin-like [Leptodactylus fuscus]|uniref:uromodulin-like n=1 Tax=Leptodactylus fuscus TaxID=238119 RepID=UPI003F4E46EA
MTNSVTHHPWAPELYALPVSRDDVGGLHGGTESPSCYPRCATDEICEVVQNEATCVCNSTTYIGINITSLQPVVNCDGGAMTPSISLCQLKQLGYNATSLHIVNNSITCTFPYEDVINNIKVESLQLKAAVGWCGNTVTKTDTKIYFSNTLYVNPNSGPLITKNPIAVNFSCEYNLTMQTSLNYSLHPVISINNLPSINGSGAYAVTMAVYKNPSFNDPLQQDDFLTVESIIYLGLFSPTMDGNVFALRAEKCFATPINDPNYANPLVFVRGGCAVNNDIQTTIVENGNSTQARIQTTAFLFNGYPEVYIFCDVRLCNKTAGCTGCNIARASEAETARLGVHLNLDANFYSNSGHNIAASWAIMAASLLGLIVKLF